MNFTLLANIFPNLKYDPQVAEKILNKKEMEFYKWNGDLSQLLQNVRDKLNKVAEVSFLPSSKSYLLSLSYSY